MRYMSIKRSAALFVLISMLFSSCLSLVSYAAPNWGGNWGGGSWGDGWKDPEEEEDPFVYDVSAGQLVGLGLSVISINTVSGDYVTSRLEYVDATMGITLSKEFRKCTNAYTQGELPIEIKGRGNSTWNNGYKDGKPNTLPGDTHTRKVPYNIKLSEKADLFGMGERKSWVLISNYMDRTNMRNKLIYDLSANMGMTYTDSVYVNLVLNGEYMGVYMLCEKIDEELFSGAVTDWNELIEGFAKGIAADRQLSDEEAKLLEDELTENLSWLDDGYYRKEGEKKKYRLSDYVDMTNVSLTNGFLIEYDGYADEESFFTTNHGVPLKIKNMEYIKTSPKTFSYVQSYFNDFEDALYSDTFYNSKGKHYSDYINVNSFVDYYILNAIILNVEFGYKSMFMHMDKEGKLVLGPCWDYDWSSGNPFLGANGEYNKWYNDGRAGNNHWYHQLYGDPWFVNLVQERWQQVRLGIIDMIESMDYYYDYLAPTVENIEYDKFSKDPYERDFAGRTGGRTFYDEYLQLKTFLEKRFEWMDEQFNKRDPDIEKLGYDADNSFSLTLEGVEAELKPKEKESYGADFSATEKTDVTVQVLDAKAGQSYSFYVNGLYFSSAVAEGKEQPLSVTVTEDMLDDGVNVICVMKNVSQDRLVAEGVNYISFTMPGEKREAVTAGRLLANTNPTQKPSNNGGNNEKPQEKPSVDPEQEKEERRQKIDETVTVIILIALIVLPIGGVCIWFIVKLRKNLKE